MTVFDDIEARYGFALPATYRAMATSGCFDTTSAEYLWLGNCEWLEPVDVLRYVPMDFHKPGFIPFGHNGGGDHWSWWPAYRAGIVVMCPHDSPLGEFDSPSFEAFLYQRALEYAHGGFDLQDEADARQQMRTWALRLAPYIAVEWCDVLREVAENELRTWTHLGFREHGLVTPDELLSIARRDFGFDELGHEFEWMLTDI